MNHTDHLRNGTRSPWRTLGLGVGFVAAALAPWPAGWVAALDYLGEPIARVRAVMVIIGAAAMGLAVLARRAPAPPMHTPGWTMDAAAAVLIIAAALPRVYWPVEFVRLGAPDHVEYALGAVELLETGRYSITLGGVEQPPRYPFGYSAFFVAPVLAVLGHEPRNAVFASLLCALGVLLLIWGQARACFGDVAAALTVGTLLLFPAFVKYATEVFAEQAVVLLFLAILGLSIRWAGNFLQSSHGTCWQRHLLVLGLLIGLSTSVKFSLGLLALVPAVLCVRRARLRRGSAQFATTALGVVVGAAPLLISNTIRFGAPLRTGYHYWCSVPYDFTSLTFSMHYLWRGAGQSPSGNMIGYLLPSIGNPQLRSAELGFEIAFWVLVVAGTIALWMRRKSSQESRARWQYACATVGAGFVFGAFHGLYFFHDLRFLLPVYVALVPIAVWCLLKILGLPERLSVHRGVGVAVLGVICAAVWILGPRWSRPSQQFRRDLDAGRNRLVAAAQTRVPADGLIISNLDGAFVQYYLLRGTRRHYLPLDRSVEYASKYVQPRSPAVREPPTDDPFGHRTVRLPGAAEVYPRTAMEVLSDLAAQKGTTFWLVLEDPFDAAAQRVVNEHMMQLHGVLRLEEVQSLPFGGIWRAEPW